MAIRLARDLTGQPFERLTVVCRDITRPRWRQYWWCLCICGKAKSIYGGSLVAGRSRSCGCLNIDLIRERGNPKIQQHKAEYRAWRNIKNRCLNPRVKSYSNYGGR